MNSFSAVFSSAFLLFGIVSCGAMAQDSKSQPPVTTIWAEIRVLDSATGRGVPLVELETVNGLKFLTDNAGRVAFHEPGLMDREIYFHVRSHGYEARKDGFGYSGVRVIPRAGAIAEIKLTRQNVAERLCRLTGEGRYRDSDLLGYKIPLPTAVNPGRVAGQDSILSVIYGKRVYWFWGDTSRMEYPLGLFRVAGATTPVPDVSDPASDPASGLPYEYFVDPKTHFARSMMPLAERPEGVIWLTSVFVVPDERGVERLAAHYSRRKGLGDEYEQGIAVFSDEKAVFESTIQFPLDSYLQLPGHPTVYEDAGKSWLLFGSPTPNLRVPAKLKDVLDAKQYEVFTCAKEARNGKPTEPLLDENRKPIWRWQRELPPVDSGTEAKWIADGKISPEFARFHPIDATAPTSRIILHSGSVRWNEYRKRWVMLAGQLYGKPSMLGEVWYAEADQPIGPFTKALRVVTHDRQTFYNVCHHAFMDREGGRVIHFEGTYSREFSGNPESTPRYNYNQMLYRLDLDAEALVKLRTP